MYNEMEMDKRADTKLRGSFSPSVIPRRIIAQVHRSMRDNEIRPVNAIAIMIARRFRHRLRRRAFPGREFPARQAESHFPAAPHGDYS